MGLEYKCDICGIVIATNPINASLKGNDVKISNVLYDHYEGIVCTECQHRLIKFLGSDKACETLYPDDVPTRIEKEDSDYDMAAIHKPSLNIRLGRDD